MAKPDQYYKNAAKGWFERAADDLLWTANNIKTKFYTQACFTSQQSAEKALKAYLRSKRVEIDKSFKTHQLAKLLSYCVKIDRSFSALEANCRILNEYYAPTRYPEMLDLEFRDYTEKEADDAYGLAKEIVDFVKKKISR